MNKLLCRSCGYVCGTVSKKLEQAIDAFTCPKCDTRTIRKFLDNDDGEPNDRLHMTMEQKCLEIMDRDLPMFLEWMEKKYTKEFMAEHYAQMILIMEGGQSDKFLPRFNGTNRSIFRTAHAAIRLVAGEMDKTVPEMERIRVVMNTVWQALEKDIGSQGVPDTIYDAFMKAHPEQGSGAENPPSPPSSSSTMEEPN